MAYQNLLAKQTNRIVFSLYVALFIGMYAPQFLGHDGRVHSSGLGALGRDFINYWSAAKLVLSGSTETLFSISDYYTWLKSEFSQSLSFHNWSYPPQLLLFIWPLGFLPYTGAFIAWIIAGLLALYKALSALIDNRADTFVLLLAPATFINIYTGQNGFFSAALLLGSFAILDKRPILAGILIGLLTFKPQLGIFIPVVLLLMRQWKTIFAAIITTLILFAISALAFGLDVWVDYITKIIPAQQMILKQAGPPFNYMVPSAYMAVKNMGLSENLATVLQFVSSLIALVAVIWGFMKPRDRHLQIALFCVCTLMFSPYVVFYDMVILAPSAYLYYRFIQNSDFKYKNAHYIFALFIAFLPLIGNISSQAGLQIYPIIMAAFLGVLIFCLSKPNKRNLI